MNNSRKTSRREFVTLAAATTLVAGQSAGVLSSAKAHIIAPTTLPQGSVSPNSKIRLATIGHGIIGRIDTLTALQVPGVEMVAVADIYDGRFVRAKELYGKSIFTTRDYKEILVRPDIDAVIVSTPDHWHARIAVDALNAGKHVYCEKPMVYAIDEGKRIIEAQRKTGKVLQVGSQFASSIVYRRAKELLASGAIGELNMVEAWWNRNNALGAWQYYIPPDASPQTIDWNRFLGSAPKRPFEPIRLFRWRNYRDYGTAVAGDLFVHLFTGINYITNSMGPTRIVSLGGLRYWKDGRDVPDMMVGIYDYPQTSAHPAFNLQLSVNFMSGAPGSGLQFIGTEGVMMVADSGVMVTRAAAANPNAQDRYALPSFPEAMQETLAKQLREQTAQNNKQTSSDKSESRFAPPQGYDSRLDHFTNFFNAVRTGQPVVEDATFGLRAAGPALLTNRSYYDKRAYSWNPETMKVTGK